MQKRASYNEVYQLYKKAGWWDNVKSDLGKAWDSFNSYADKNQWVRPALYGAGGALGGYGLGSFFKNPLLRVLFAILGGAGGLYGGLKHNEAAQKKPADINYLLAKKQNTPKVKTVQEIADAYKKNALRPDADLTNRFVNGINADKTQQSTATTPGNITEARPVAPAALHEQKNK